MTTGEEPSFGSSLRMGAPLKGDCLVPPPTSSVSPHDSGSSTWTLGTTVLDLYGVGDGSGEGVEVNRNRTRGYQSSSQGRRSFGRDWDVRS